MSEPKKPAEVDAKPGTLLEEGELTEDALEQVSGGTKVAAALQDVTTNKQKTAEKAAAAADAYIRG
jgi:hypothetical protein